MEAKSHFIDGHWRPGAGEALASRDPSNGSIVWQGRGADAAEIDQAVAAARAALDDWSARPLESRIEILNRFAGQLKSRRSELADAISREGGKPRWEALTEVDSMIGKVPASIDAYRQRRAPVVQESPAGTTATRYKPYGALAVFGPFNFPGHLPNGHVVPALLAGNTVVFKPSELTPLVAQRTVEAWVDAGIPHGAINLVQGARQTGAALAAHPGIDGLLFTGSAAVGRALSRIVADHPEKMLALEMGGNNPLIVHQAADCDAAAYLTIQSAFITAGQRCTCARRLIVPDGSAGDRFLDRLVEMTRAVRVGRPTDDPEPFMGPVIHAAAAERVLASQAALRKLGGRALLESQTLDDCPALLSPGIMDVTRVKDRPDEEIFGPFLQVIRTDGFDAALAEANRTAFGLAAGLLSDSRELYERFFRAIRAGVVNWNRQTTGASGALPFGGVGLSGNHHPSGSWAADYCSYPVASLEHPRLTLPPKLAPGIAV